MFSLFDDAVKHFISDHVTAVIATVDSGGQPHSSTIFYILQKDHLYFVTKSQTMKAQDLAANERASLTIIDGDRPAAVNAIGTVHEIQDIKQRDDIMQLVFKEAHDKLRDYAPIVKLHKGSFRVYQLTLTKATMTDYSKPIGEVEQKQKKF